MIFLYLMVFKLVTFNKFDLKTLFAENKLIKKH